MRNEFHRSHQNCQLKNKEALQYFKGLSEDRGRADFLKTFRASLLTDSYRMSLILAGSISLESTSLTSVSTAEWDPDAGFAITFEVKFFAFLHFSISLRPRSEGCVASV